MGEAGRRRVEAHFTWERIAERTLDVYRQAIEAHRRAPAT
jgi:starch synthase